MSREAPFVQHEAYVLHARKYRDTSLLVDALTRDTGRLSFVARGARSGRKRTHALAQPFVLLLVTAHGQGELKTMGNIEALSPPSRLRGDGLLLGMYANELLYRTLGRFDPVPGVFAEYGALLARLAAAGDTLALAEPALRRFELCVLAELGYGVSFDYDARTGDLIREDTHYRYFAEDGFHPAVERDAGNRDDIYLGGDLIAIATGDYAGPRARIVRQVVRESFARILGGRPLKSRTLFEGRA